MPGKARRARATNNGNRLEGGGGNDTFVFQRGQANGDTVVDFGGNGPDPGDAFEFVGYGPGATFVQLDATHWQVNSGDGLTHETITLQNGAAVHASDVLFVGPAGLERGRRASRRRAGARSRGSC